MSAPKIPPTHDQLFPACPCNLGELWAIVNRLAHDASAQRPLHSAVLIEIVDPDTGAVTQLPVASVRDSGGKVILSNIDYAAK